MWSKFPGTLQAITAFVVAVAGLIAALTAIGVFKSGDAEDADRSPRGAAAPTALTPTSAKRPLVVRLTRGDQVTRGFVTPKGFIIATAETSQAGYVASWTDLTGEHRAKVALAQPAAGFAPGAVVLKVVGNVQPTRQSFSMRDTNTLKQGESIVAYLGPGRENPGTVRRTGESQSFEAPGSPKGTLTVADNLLTTDKVSDTGSIPIFDTHGAMVAMTMGDDSDSSFSIAIENLLNEFPDAF